MIGDSGDRCDSNDRSDRIWYKECEVAKNMQCLVVIGMIGLTGKTIESQRGYCVVIGMIALAILAPKMVG